MGSEDIITLIQQLGELDPAIPDRQFEAAMSLCELTSDSTLNEVLDALIEALGASQALVRAHAAEALGNLCGNEQRKAAVSQRAAAPLVAALQDSYRLVRSYAARALGQLGDPAAIMPLLKVLGHDSFFGVRAEAAEALRKLCPDESAPDSRVAMEALEAYRAAELNRNEERSRRVLAEMDLSLKELRGIVTDIEEALSQGKSDYALSLARRATAKVTAAQYHRDRMGGLLASRDRI